MNNSELGHDKEDCYIVEWEAEKTKKKLLEIHIFFWYLLNEK